MPDFVLIVLEASLGAADALSVVGSITALAAPLHHGVLERSTKHNSSAHSTCPSAEELHMAHPYN
jgi:hypothetical protein